MSSVGADARFRPRAVIFDMDGLLVDSEPLWWRVETAFAATIGCEWTAELAATCVGTGIKKTVERMAEIVGVPVDADEGARRIVDEFVRRVGELELKPGALTLLETVHGRRPSGLATSSPPRLIDAVFDRFGIGRMFDAVVSGEWVAHPKPAPDIFLETARRLGQAPSECLVLEDSLAGVTSALAASMKVIAIPETHPPPSGFSVAHAVLPSLDAAREIIELS